MISPEKRLVRSVETKDRERARAKFAPRTRTSGYTQSAGKNDGRVPGLGASHLIPSLFRSGAIRASGHSEAVGTVPLISSLSYTRPALWFRPIYVWVTSSCLCKKIEGVVL